MDCTFFGTPATGWESGPAGTSTTSHIAGQAAADRGGWVSGMQALWQCGTATAIGARLSNGRKNPIFLIGSASGSGIAAAVADKLYGLSPPAPRPSRRCPPRHRCRLQQLLQAHDARVRARRARAGRGALRPARKGRSALRMDTGHELRWRDCMPLCNMACDGVLCSRTSPQVIGHLADLPDFPCFQLRNRKRPRRGRERMNC